MQKLQPIFFRFLSIALILNGTLLMVNWFKNESPNKDQLILWIAAANLLIGLAAFFSSRRKANANRSKEQD